MKLPQAQDRCIATNRKNGKQCKMLHREGSQYCHLHDPKGREKRLLNSSKGGKMVQLQRRLARGEIVPVSFRNMGDVYSLLERTIGDLWRMESSISRDKALIIAIQTGIRVLEVGGYEARLERLEALLGKQNRKELENGTEYSYEIEGFGKDDGPSEQSDS